MIGHGQVVWMFHNYSLIIFCNLLKNPEVKYSKALYKKIEDIKDEYDKTVQKSIKKEIKDQADDYEIEQIKATLFREYQYKCLSVCVDESVLCNIIIDMCYKESNKSKQFAWETCGDIIIKNLLEHHNNIIKYPVQSKDGDITYKGLTFKMEELVYETDSE